MSVNQVILIGNLGKNPELNYTATGNAVCKFSIATSDNWTDKDGAKQSKTEWHNIVVWNKQAEFCAGALAKGKQVVIEGKLTTRSWEDKEGNKRYITEVLANRVHFLSSPDKPDRIEEMSDYVKEPIKISNEANFSTEDIPF